MFSAESMFMVDFMERGHRLFFFTSLCAISVQIYIHVDSMWCRISLPHRKRVLFRYKYTYMWIVCGCSVWCWISLLHKKSVLFRYKYTYMWIVCGCSVWCGIFLPYRKSVISVQIYIHVDSVWLQCMVWDVFATQEECYFGTNIHTCG